MNMQSVWISFYYFKLQSLRLFCFVSASAESFFKTRTMEIRNESLPGENSFS